MGAFNHRGFGSLFFFGVTIKELLLVGDDDDDDDELALATEAFKSHT
jgi:hypothetical protein